MVAPGIIARTATSTGARQRFVRTVWQGLESLTCLLVVAYIVASPAHASPIAPSLAARKISNYARAVKSSLLEVFQVYPPVLTITPGGILEITDGSSNGSVSVVKSKAHTCQEVLATHSFAYSYGVPYVGDYAPPSCLFNRVTWNLTVESAGRQFDRLGIVYFGDIELFRTSTAEPTSSGIRWTYLKDMTNYLSLFKEDQKIIFDLGNLIDSTYTGVYNVTLTAAFFTADDSIVPADLIIPVSTRKSPANMPSVFTIPGDVPASNVITLPRSIKKAVFTISSTGQSAEEFWWSNVLQSEVNTFPDYGLLYGYSPFREVQLYIDGELAGVAWPFPIIFTGGVVPGLWRPVVGIDAVDLREDEIDITPWLPLLCDGAAHNFTIGVSGLNDNGGNGTATLSGTTDSYWLVTGKIFIWLDAPGHVTTGTGPDKAVDTPYFQVSSLVGTGVNGTNDTLVYKVNAQRALELESTVNFSHGKKSVSWRQSLAYSNAGDYTDGGNVEVNNQQTTGYDISSSGYSKHLSYPLYAYSAYAVIADNISIIAEVNRGKDIVTIGQSVFPTGLEAFSSATAIRPAYKSFQGASLSTTQNGNATYLANETSSTSFSFGSTTQDMTFSGITYGVQRNTQGFPLIDGSRELFTRHVVAENGTVVEDDETLVTTAVKHDHGGPGNPKGFSIDRAPGRGSNWHGFGQRRKA